MTWNLSNEDLYNTIRKVYELGGQIFYDQCPSGAANATATGTAAATISIAASYSVPSAAREIIAVSPSLTSTADAAADSKMGYVSIIGANYKFQPQQIPAPVGSVVLSVGATRFTPREWWTVRAPCASGDTYNVQFSSLIANTHNMKAACSFMYSTVNTGLRPIYSQIQSAVTTVVNAGNTSTGTLSLTGAHELYEFGTLTSPETATVAQENQILTHSMSSSALSPVQTHIYPDEIPAQVAATSGDTQMVQMARHLALGSKFTNTNPVLSYTSTLDVATSNNMSVAHYVRYI